MSRRGVNISVSYTVHLDLILLQRDLQFSPSVENRAL